MNQDIMIAYINNPYNKQNVIDINLIVPDYFCSSGPLRVKKSILLSKAIRANITEKVVDQIAILRFDPAPNGVHV